MSDRETLKAILDRAGIVYDDGETLSVWAKTGPNNQGYDGFSAELGFDGSGALKTWSVWEGGEPTRYAPGWDRYGAHVSPPIA